MGRETDTKVRGFMVTETNNDACAQLQLCSTHASPFAHARTSDQASPRLASIRWAVGPFLSIPIKLTAGGKPQICLCLDQLQIPLTLALKSGLTHPPSLGTQGIYTKIYTVDASGIQVSKQNHIHINMENDQKIAHRVNCAMIKNDDRSDTICTVNQVTDFHRNR